jgi:stearoyl-CoA desaturase (delta-9 desaturase)
VIILIFFVVHWQASVFLQSFFHHRYGAHKQFTMSKGWERFFHLLAWTVQGSSYLSPRAYAILHRMHHAYSDTPKDPHSPVSYPNFFKMMWRTKAIYQQYRYRRVDPEPRFDGGYPVWPLLDDTLNSYPVSIAWGTLYTFFYMAFATHWWMFLLLPVHWYMGVFHGAIVNWCGHKYGYKNFSNGDASRNTLVFDVLTMGELFQNNHHKFGQSPNFGARWYEIDPAYQLMRLLAALKIIDMSGAQTMKLKGRGKALPPAAPAAEEGAQPSAPVATPVPVQVVEPAE